MHLEIYKLAISFREEFMASKNLIGEKFMIPCKNIHPCWWKKYLEYKPLCYENILTVKLYQNIKDWKQVSLGVKLAEKLSIAATHNYAVPLLDSIYLVFQHIRERGKFGTKSP